MDDTMLGKLLTEAHREYADYRSPEGVSVSQSSLSVAFDRTVKPVGENNVDQSSFGVRNTYSAHNKFPAITQAEKMVGRTEKPVGESSSSAQIRTLLDEQFSSCSCHSFIHVYNVLFSLSFFLNFPFLIFHVS